MQPTGCSTSQCVAEFGANSYCDVNTNGCLTYECTKSNDCTDGQTCDMTTHTCTGTCTTQGKKEAGATCSVNCDCAKGLSCNPNSSTCVATSGCPTGIAVDPNGGGACDAETCGLGAGFGVGGCVCSNNPSYTCQIPLAECAASPITVCP